MLLLCVLSQVTSNSSVPTFCTVCVLLSVYCCTGVSLFVCLFGFYGGFVLPRVFPKPPVAPSAAPGLEQEVPGWDASLEPHKMPVPFAISLQGDRLTRHGSVVLHSHPADLFLDPPVLNFELPCSPSSRRG